MQDLAAFRPLLKRNSTGDAIVGVDAVNRQAVECTIPLREVALRVNGLTLALFVGADTKISGYGHG